MTYQNESLTGDKLLQPDGSIITRGGVIVAGADAQRAAIYQLSTPMPDKLLQPDGSVITGKWSAAASGPAGGDLGGSFPNPTVGGINGAPVPASAPLLGSNAAAQLISVTVPLSVANFEQHGLTANFPITLLYTVPAGQGGLYLLSTVDTITTPATTSSTLPYGVLLWTEQDTGAALICQISSPLTNNVLGYNSAAVPTFRNVVAFRAAAGSLIRVQTTGYASVPAAMMMYSVRFNLLYLG